MDNNSEGSADYGKRLMRLLDEQKKKHKTFQELSELPGASDQVKIYAEYLKSDLATVEKRVRNFRLMQEIR